MKHGSSFDNKESARSIAVSILRSLTMMEGREVSLNQKTMKKTKKERNVAAVPQVDTLSNYLFFND